jgi:predicted DsbA family dithiol-disulfide isomerase
MCPFCYIGKRRLEEALAQLPANTQLSIEWKSFQLDPNMKSEPGKNINQYLAERKGWSLEQARQMNGQVTKMAQDVGLSYDFDKAVIGNSFDAHRLIQMAKGKGLGDAAEERLFRAYFTEGKDFSDHAVLVQLGTDIGLEAAAVQQMLAGNDYAEAVRKDLKEAEQIGVTGVPFFVFDRKYAISGAQPTDVFVKTLEKSLTEWQAQHAPGLDISNGPVCTPDGKCD